MKARAKFMKPYCIKTDKIELKEEVDDQLPKEIEAFLNTDGEYNLLAELLSDINRFYF